MAVVDGVMPFVCIKPDDDFNTSIFKKFETINTLNLDIWLVGAVFFHFSHNKCQPWLTSAKKIHFFSLRSLVAEVVEFIRFGYNRHTTLHHIDGEKVCSSIEVMRLHYTQFNMKLVPLRLGVYLAYMGMYVLRVNESRINMCVCVREIKMKNTKKEESAKGMCTE